MTFAKAPARRSLGELKQGLARHAESAMRAVENEWIKAATVAADDRQVELAFPHPGRRGLIIVCDCTATKISAFKFLTAAHCIGNTVATRRTIVTRDEGQVNLTIPSGGIQVHPSYTLLSEDGAPSSDYYDVAVITTTMPTSPTGIPPSSSQTPIRQATATTVVGFGCDRQKPANGGLQQSGQFNLTGVTDHHDLTSTGVPAGCPGDSGSPALSNTDSRILGVLYSGFEVGGFTRFSRMSNVRAWVSDPRPGNHASLFQAAGTLYFMHNKPATPGLLGLCMASSAGSGADVPVMLSECSDLGGQLTNGRSAGWIILPVPSFAGRFQIVNIATGGCLAPKNGAENVNLRLETCSASNTRHQWTFSTTPALNVPTLRIKNVSSGFCIRSENNSTAHGTLVEQHTCDVGATSGQSWVAMR